MTKKKYYSHSKIGTFEQCPRKFKFKYIEKIPEELKTIEAHLGTVVHATLEWLYSLKIENKKIPDISEVISYYTEKWREEFSTETKIIKQGMELKDYFSKGVQFLLEYYNRNYPFDDNTLEVEKKILINLDDDGKYLIQGYIDRLSHNKEKDEYEIHDYKTSNSFPDKEKVENDRQLALYSLAIREVIGEDKNICLTWHYLAFDKKVCSRRTNEQLNELKEKILEQIKEIESTEKFPTFISPLCDWCGYKKICPAWK
ncbi:MAG: PD-(D/E)XK nuclease family protein [Candidatus Pacearchaeota archaeon]|jgi:RecB family exonuclease